MFLTINKNIGYGGLNIDIEDYNIIIHTTPVGMYPNINTKPIIDVDKINKDILVMDLIYNPKETVLLKESRKRGAKAINGLGMLVYQGAIAFEIWTGIKPDIKVMKRKIENVI